jgi:hypothetical protein
VQLYLKRVGNPGESYWELYYPGDLTGSHLLETHSFDPSIVTLVGGWVTFDFTTPLLMQTSEILYLLIRNLGGDGSNKFQLYGKGTAGDATNEYEDNWNGATDFESILNLPAYRLQYNQVDRPAPNGYVNGYRVTTL